MFGHTGTYSRNLESEASAATCFSQRRQVVAKRASSCSHQSWTRVLEFMAILVIGPVSWISSTIASGKEPVGGSWRLWMFCRQFIVVSVQDYWSYEFLGHCFGVHEQDVIFVCRRGSLDVMCSTIQDSQKGVGAHEDIFGAFKVDACCTTAWLTNIGVSIIASSLTWISHWCSSWAAERVLTYALSCFTCDSPLV